MADWLIALLCMGAYLVFAFWLGLAAGRGRSFWSVSEYAVAERGLGVIVMWFLMGGMIFSAFAFLGGPGWAFERGAASYYLIAYVCLGILPWYVIGPKLARLGAERNWFTMGDFLYDRYRSKVLVVVVGIVSVLAFIQYLTLQIKGMAYVFNVMTEGAIPFWLGALLSYGIVIVYVATSGVRGAAWSDVLQGLLMLIVAWTLGFWLVYSLHGGVEPMFRAIATERPDYLVLGHEGSQMSRTAYSTAVLVSVIGFLMWPHLFTKSFVATERTIKLSVLAYPFFAIFLLPVLLIGFSAIGVISPESLSSPDEVLPHLATNNLGASGWLYGLIGAGALAAAMSSADAISHAGSVSLARDVVLPFRPALSERAQIWLMRVSVVGIGAAAYYLAIFGSAGLIQLLLGAYGSIVQFAPAIYGALFWPRATKEGAIAGLVVGVVVNFYLEVVLEYAPFDINAGIVGLVCNILIFVGLSLALSRKEAPAYSR